MLNWPNIISLMRFPLAFLFFQENPYYRGIAILLAMVSDGLDGYIARKYKLSSQVGAWLDPIMDKFFVLVAVSVLFLEQKILLWEICAMMGRDFAVLTFGFYLILQRRLLKFHVRAIWWGKVITVLQFAAILYLVFYGAIPSYFYFIFIILSLCALKELFERKHVTCSESL